MASYNERQEETGMREECAVFGIVASGEWPTNLDLSHLIHMGLVSLQHRGQESAGIVTANGDGKSRFIVRKHMGLVGSTFSQEDMKSLTGNLGIGHCRYGTYGSSDSTNIQPFVVETLHGLLATAHNGEIVNVAKLKHELLKHGVGLSSGSDSEILTQLITHMPEDGEPHGANWVERIRNMMIETECSYSLVIMHKDRIWAVRDPYGNRPLCVGKLYPADAFTSNRSLDPDEHEAWIVASESCAFNPMGAKYYRDVMPGEILEITRKGIFSRCIVPRPENKLPAFCIFEYVYFARSDTQFQGQMVSTVRRRCGQQLALQWPVDADLISTVPESATPSAMEYAKTLGIPYMEVLSKNRYVGRTFIQPSQRLRKLGVMKKFGPLTDNFVGKRLVLVDDSIVRGTTMSGVVAMLKRCGAKEVHIRVASPPIKHPCYMGINIPTKEELVANQKSVDEMAKDFGADSVRYLSLDGLVQAVEQGLEDSKEPVGHCTACLSGNYPVEKLDW